MFWLAERMPLDELAHALEEESGLLDLGGSADISAERAKTATWVVQAREDLQIARETRMALARRTTDGASVASADESPLADA